MLFKCTARLSYVPFAAVSLFPRILSRLTTIVASVFRTTRKHIEMRFICFALFSFLFSAEHGVVHVSAYIISVCVQSFRRFFLKSDADQRLPDFSFSILQCTTRGTECRCSKFMSSVIKSQCELTWPCTGSAGFCLPVDYFFFRYFHSPNLNGILVLRHLCFALLVAGQHPMSSNTFSLGNHDLVANYNQQLLFHVLSPDFGLVLSLPVTLSFEQPFHLVRIFFSSNNSY